MMGDILFFRLDTKEKIPKERIKAVFFLLLSSCVSLKGLELAALRQSPLWTLHYGRSLGGEKIRPRGGTGAYGRWEGCLGVVRRVLRGYEMPPYHILLFGVTYNIRGDVYYYFLYVRMSGKGDYWPGIFFLCGELAIPIRTVVNRSLFRRRRCLRGRYRRKDILPHSRTR